MQAAWDEFIPAEYLEQVMTPLDFECFEEPEARAMKYLGYDDRKKCCFYRHQFTLTRAVMDEDGIFHEEESFFEEVRAWRLENGSWLRRTVRGDGAGDCRTRLFRPAYEIVSERPR